MGRISGWAQNAKNVTFLINIGLKIRKKGSQNRCFLSNHMDFDKDFWHFFQIAVVLNSASAPPSKMPYFYRVFWEPKSVFWGVGKSIIGGSDACLHARMRAYTRVCTRAYAYI